MLSQASFHLISGGVNYNIFCLLYPRAENLYTDASVVYCPEVSRYSDVYRNTNLTYGQVNLKTKGKPVIFNKCTASVTNGDYIKVFKISELSILK